MSALGPLWVVLSRWVRANKQTFRLGAGKQTLPKAVHQILATPYPHADASDASEQGQLLRHRVHWS